MRVDFGFYPLQFDADYGDVHIETRDDFESSVKAVKSQPSVEGDWIYFPGKELHALGSNSIRAIFYARLRPPEDTHADPSDR